MGSVGSFFLTLEDLRHLYGGISEIVHPRSQLIGTSGVIVSRLCSLDAFGNRRQISKRLALLRNSLPLIPVEESGS